MPALGQEETVRIVSLERDFHVQCYRCEVSAPPSLPPSELLSGHGFTRKLTSSLSPPLKILLLGPCGHQELIPVLRN